MRFFILLVLCASLIPLMVLITTVSPVPTTNSTTQTTTTVPTTSSTTQTTTTTTVPTTSTTQTTTVIPTLPPVPLNAQWARSVIAAPSISFPYKTATDSDGNIYSVGYVRGTLPFNFGNNVSTNGQLDSSESAFLVKYNANGTAQWVVTVQSPLESTFLDITISSNGNIYVVGYFEGNVNFGNGVILTGPGASNPLLIVYNSSGIAQWARTSISTSDVNSRTFYFGVHVDIDENIYLCGYTRFNSSLGNNVIIGNTSTFSPILVKYNSSGIAQWANSISSNISGYFDSVSVALDGNVYVSGYVSAGGFIDFGNGINITSVKAHPLLLKYNSIGIPQWLRTVPYRSRYYDVQLDSDDNIYVVGFLELQSGQTVYDYGNGVNYTNSIQPLGGFTCILLKYNSAGIAQWVKGAVLADSQFYGLSIGIDGSIYVVGNIGNGNNIHDFGNGVSVFTNATFGNHLIVKYHTSGITQWAKVVSHPSYVSLNAQYFKDVSIAPDGSIVVVGTTHGGSSVYDFGNNVNITSPSPLLFHFLLVKYA